MAQQMKGLQTSGVACSGQNRATAQPRNSAGKSFTQSPFGFLRSTWMSHQNRFWIKTKRALSKRGIDALQIYTLNSATGLWAQLKRIGRIFLCLVAIVCCVPLLSIAQQEDAQYSEFKAFLSASRPPIKIVRLTRSAVYYYYSLKRPITFEASIQSNTCYVKVESLFHTGPTNFDIVGMSYENYWHISEQGQVSVANRNPTVSGTNTVTEQTYRMQDNELEEVLGLGITYFDRQSIVWNRGALHSSNWK